MNKEQDPTIYRRDRPQIQRYKWIESKKMENIYYAYNIQKRAEW